MEKIMTLARKYQIYELFPCKFHSVPLLAFKRVENLAYENWVH